MKIYNYSNIKSSKSCIKIYADNATINYIEDNARRMGVDVQTVVDLIIEARYKGIKERVKTNIKIDMDAETYELRKQLEAAKSLPAEQVVYFKGYKITAGDASRILNRMNQEFNKPNKRQLALFEASEEAQPEPQPEPQPQPEKQPEAKQKPQATVAVPDSLLEEYTRTGCTLGRINNTKYMQRVNITSLWGDISFLYKGSRRGAFEEVKKQFDSFKCATTNGNKLLLYFDLNESAELVATAEEFETEGLRQAAAFWHLSRSTFAPLPLALPAACVHDSMTSTPTIKKADNKPLQSKKRLNWDDIPEEEKHPEPEFYKNLRQIARDYNQECIEAYRFSADTVTDNLKTNPNGWRNYEPGMFLNLEDCGLKMDGANNIGGAIETMVESEKHIKPCLSMIEKIIDCTDEDLQLFSYTDGLPEGCAAGGHRCDDDEVLKKAKAAMYDKYLTHDERRAAERKYYSYFFTLVTMYRSPNYCLFIDAEGYTWSRYILFLPTWRTMYADDLKAAQLKEQQRQEEEAAEQLIAETNELLKYNADCDRLRPYMVADLSTLELNDRQGRQNGRRRNIMAVLRHFFPGYKFSVKYRWATQNEIEIFWIDGPQEEEVEKCCNWSIFCDRWQSFDGMTDCWEYGSRKYTTFAESYGGGSLFAISFNRSFSAERTKENEETARVFLESCGVNPITGIHMTKKEFPTVCAAIAEHFGRPVADWLHNWSNIDTYALSRSIMATNAD